MASIAVVGAGLAGLTCAWRLARAGHDVELLEREAEVGGRARARTFEDCRLDDGACFDLGNAPDLVAVARALGIATRLRPLPGTALAVLRGGAFHPLEPQRARWWLQTPLLSARARLSLLGSAARAFAATGRSEGAARAACLDADARDAASWLAERTGGEAAVFAAGPLLGEGGHELAGLSAGVALSRLARLLRAPRPACFAHGNQQLAEALAAGLRVRTSCEVTGVETQTRGARIRCRVGSREDQVLADAAVVAVPADGLSALCRKLTPDERGLLEPLRAARVTRVHLRLAEIPIGLAEPIWCRVLPLPEHATEIRVYATHLRPGATPPGAGLLCVELPEVALRRERDAGDAALLAALLERLERTPIGRLRLLAHRVEALARAPHFGPGALARALRFDARLERSPRLAFAGDWRVGPEAHAAVTSGMRAATEVIRTL